LDNVVNPNVWIFFAIILPFQTLTDGLRKKLM